jgi:hypothetical protein
MQNLPTGYLGKPVPIAMRLSYPFLQRIQGSPKERFLMFVEKSEIGECLLDNQLMKIGRSKPKTRHQIDLRR